MRLYLVQFVAEDAGAGYSAQHVLADDIVSAIRTLSDKDVVAAALVSENPVVAVDKRH
jgi:hypothetical protein